jgi:hypothetical protein
MSKIRVLPHRTIAPADINWGPWQVKIGTRTLVDPELLTEWDYSVSIEVSTWVTLAPDPAAAVTGVDVADMELAIVADCPSANVRLAATAPISADGTAGALILIPAGVMADSVRLSHNIVVRSDSTTRPSGAAKRSGAVLAASPKSVIGLEGTAGRFPTEAAEFESLGRIPAPWTVVATFDGLDESFVGTVRLLVNTQHPVGALAVSPDHPEALDDMLKADVVRRLILDIANRDIDLSAECPDESVGQVLSSLSELHLNMSLETAVKTMRSDPGHFEDLLAVAMDPLRKVWTT